MKKSIMGFVLLATLSACTKTVHTHEQVMTRFSTRESVIKQFGWPDEIMEVNGVTEWLYNRDEIPKLAVSKTPAKGNNGVDLIPDSLSNRTVSEFTPFAKYVKFTFDKQGKVLGYSSHGVNYAEKKKNPLATALLVTGIIIIIAGGAYMISLISIPD